MKTTYQKGDVVNTVLGIGEIISDIKITGACYVHLQNPLKDGDSAGQTDVLLNTFQFGKIESNTMNQQVSDTPISEQSLPPCFCCKKIWKRKDTDKYVYYDKVGVVCQSHHGVKQWYDNLIATFNEQLRKDGVIPAWDK